MITSYRSSLSEIRSIETALAAPTLVVGLLLGDGIGPIGVAGTGNAFFPKGWALHL
jgi:hypothetical protein